MRNNIVDDSFANIQIQQLSLHDQYIDNTWTLNDVLQRLRLLIAALKGLRNFEITFAPTRDTADGYL